MPQLPGCSRHGFAGLLVRIVDQAAAIKTCWRAAPVAIRHTNLVNGNRGCALPDVGRCLAGADGRLRLRLDRRLARTGYQSGRKDYGYEYSPKGGHGLRYHSHYIDQHHP